MPILLKTPFDPGSSDKEAKQGYPHCQIIQFLQNSLTFSVALTYEFGTASGDYYEKWEKGAGSPTKTVEIAGQDVAALWSQMPNDKESVGAAMRRLTYQWLIDDGIADGTVADTPPLPPVTADNSAPAEADQA